MTPTRVAAFAALLLVALAGAAPADAGGRCVVLVLPPSSWGDVESADLLRLVETGAAGSLSCAVPRPMTEAAAWVTLGAGNRALWSEALWPGQPFDPGDAPARAEFARRLQALNDGLPYPTEVASVGEALHEAGLRTAVIGLREPWQLAAAMDEAGDVDYAGANASPEELEQALREAEYVVVNLQAAGEPEAVRARAEQALHPEELLIIAALAPRDAPFIRLAPIIASGGGFTSGALVSAMTRRPGVVENIDLAPTILAHFGVPLPQSYTNGAVMETAEDSRFDLAAAIRLDGKGRQAYAFRHVGVPVLMLLQMVLVPLAIVKRWPASRRVRVGLMFGLMGTPVASYLTAAPPPGWPSVALLGPVLVPCVLLGLVAAGARRLSRNAAALYAAALALLTLVVVAIEMGGGAPLQPTMPLGYSLGFGGRFYGVGNEVAGLLIAAGVLAVGLFLVAEVQWSALQLERYGTALVCTILPIVFIADPNVGANAGCTVASIICFAALFALAGKRGWVCGLLLVGVVVVTVALDAWLGARPEPQAPTHIGRAWARLTAEGWPFLEEFARRKGYTAWRILAGTPPLFIAAAWALFWSYALLRPLGFVRRVYERMPAIRPPLQAIAIGGIAAALLNDTTILIPLTMLQFALPALGLASCVDSEERPTDAATGLPRD